MTTFSLLIASSEGLKQLSLFEVVDNNHQLWLVKFINKRVTYKWLYDYSSAIEYYKKSLIRNKLY